MSAPRLCFTALLRSTVAAALCGTMVFAPLAAFAAQKPAPAGAPVDRATLLVERFTFGPRPGEIAQVRSMGVDAWLERQLQPERIDDSALDARLAQYPALQMSQEERIERYPTPGEIRRFAKSGALPQDPEKAAIVADQVEFYEMRQQAKPGAATAAKLPATAGSARDASTSMTAEMAPGTKPATAGQQDAAASSAVLSLEQSTTAMPQAQVDAILALAPQQRYQRLLQMKPSDLIALRKGLRGQEAKLGDGLSPLQKETLVSLAGTNRMLSNELFGSRVLRDVYSQRELEAVMTDFWLNHFNVYIRKNQQMPSLLPQYEQTIREHALGRFEDLLVSTAKSPAMLMYLDNAESVGPDSQAASNGKRNPNAKKPNVGLNENYARELMELHTLGVTGGYTQKDVTEVAKVFTGWTIDRPGEGGEFIYLQRRHQPGAKQVLGKTIHENGESEGEEVLHMLATSPATAHFISLELAQRFVSDTPPPAMVNRMAQTFQHSEGDIRQVLRTMIHSPEFFSASTVHAKLKTPLEYVVSAARVTGADIQNPMPMAQAMERLGMPLYGCQPPTGYKWDSETWLSSSALVNRMNFSLTLAAGKVGGSTIDLPRLEGENLQAEPQQKEHALETAVLDMPASEQTRAAVLSQANDSTVQQAVRDFGGAGQGREAQTGGKRIVQVNDRSLGATPLRPAVDPVDKQGAVMLGLLLGSPEFQRR